jgi:alpha-tubulin suppressor-like RCC1 family protein
MIRTISGDDYVYCWGKNHKGQLGNENTDHQTSQTLFHYFSEWNFSSCHDLSLGKDHTCMLADFWGYSLLFCWGSNEYGQLGISGVEYSSEPLLVDYFDSSIDSVSAGSYHTCVTQDNKAYCWGLNDSGQLGINNTTTTSTPTQIVNISNIVSISAGGEHTCAINDYNGLNKLYCWGNNKHGQIDSNYTNTTSPVEITNIPTPVNKVSAGGYHTCAIGNGSNNSLYCWGNNSYGQLGDNNAPYGRTVSNRYYHFSNAVDITAGNKNHTCAVYNNNGTKQLYCWGANDNGQLGRNKVNFREDTIGSSILSGAAAYYVSAGE